MIVSFPSLKANGEQVDDRIVEVCWDPVGEHWRMMRFRDDKPQGNHRSVVENILQSIADGVEKDAVGGCSRELQAVRRGELIFMNHFFFYSFLLDRRRSKTHGKRDMANLYSSNRRRRHRHRRYLLHRRRVMGRSCRRRRLFLCPCSILRLDPYRGMPRLLYHYATGLWHHHDGARYQDRLLLQGCSVEKKV
jgi:hypothetical protein